MAKITTGGGRVNNSRNSRLLWKVCPYIVQVSSLMTMLIILHLFKEFFVTVLPLLTTMNHLKSKND